MGWAGEERFGIDNIHLHGGRREEGKDSNFRVMWTMKFFFSLFGENSGIRFKRSGVQIDQWASVSSDRGGAFGVLNSYMDISFLGNVIHYYSIIKSAP